MIEQHSYSGDYTNRYKFNGKELDEETGYYYYGARYYNPRFSIWLSVDPLAEKFPNFNPYNYVMQNPINLIDPTGMEPEEGGGDTGNKSWLSRSWNKIKSWFSSGSDYQNIPKKEGSVEVGDLELLSHKMICTYGCHNIDINEIDEDLGGKFRDSMSNVGLSATTIDASAELLKKSSMFGKYSPHIALVTGAGSIGGDYHSDSSSGEFVNNTIQTSIETFVGLKSPTIAIGLHITFEDSKTEDGLTNLKNGRLASAYGSNLKTRDNYLAANFGVKNSSIGKYKPYGSKKQYKALDKMISNIFTLKWGRIKSDTKKIMSE